MLKLVGLFVGLAAIAASRAEPPAAAPATQTTVIASAPLYAARDAFAGVGLPRP